MTCRILVLQSGIEPVPLQWKQGVLTTGPTENSLLRPFLYESQKDDFFFFLVLHIIPGKQQQQIHKVCVCISWVWLENVFVSCSA